MNHVLTSANQNRQLTANQSPTTSPSPARSSNTSTKQNVSSPLPSQKSAQLIPRFTLVRSACLTGVNLPRVVIGRRLGCTRLRLMGFIRCVFESLSRLNSQFSFGMRSNAPLDWSGIWSPCNRRFVRQSMLVQFARLRFVLMPTSCERAELNVMGRTHLPDNRCHLSSHLLVSNLG